MASKSLTKKDVEQKLTEYLIQRDGGQMLKVRVPSTWKVTFGTVNPAANGDQWGARGNRAGGYCLRFYESQNQQRALFPNVVSFFDMSMEISRPVVVDGEEATMNFVPVDLNDPEAPVPF